MNSAVGLTPTFVFISLMKVSASTFPVSNLLKASYKEPVARSLNYINEKMNNSLSNTLLDLHEEKVDTWLRSDSLESDRLRGVE